MPLLVIMQASVYKGSLHQVNSSVMQQDVS